MLPARLGAGSDRGSIAALSCKPGMDILPAHFSSAWLIFVLAGTMSLSGQDQSDQSQSDQSQSDPSQTASDEPISTDRPAVAASSIVVPKGSFQAENGLLIANNQGQRTFDGPETSLRFGVAANTELRLSAPDYYRDAASGTGVASGFGDLTIGMKQQLGPTPGGFDVSVIAFLSIPTRAAALSSHGYDPGLQAVNFAFFNELLETTYQPSRRIY